METPEKTHNPTPDIYRGRVGHDVSEGFCSCGGYHRAEDGIEVGTKTVLVGADKAIKAAKEIIESALAPHPLGMELLVNCAECGSLLNAELCCHEERAFSKQIFITVAKCQCGPNSNA